MTDTKTEPKPEFKRIPVARMFAAEIRMTTIKLPKVEESLFEAQYFLTPSGQAVSKVMITGTAIEKENIGTDIPFWRLRIADPTGSIQVYAGQYNPESAQIIAELELPTFVAVAGKLNIYESEGGDTFTSVRADSINVVSEQDRTLFILDAASLMISQATMIKANSPNPLIQKAKILYNYTAKDLFFAAQTALESITGSMETPVEIKQKPEELNQKPGETKPDEVTKEQIPEQTESLDANKLADIISDLLIKEGVLNGAGIMKCLNTAKQPATIGQLENALYILKQDGRIYEPKRGTFKSSA